MVNTYKEIRLASAEIVVAWALDFISKDLESHDLTERFKMAVDAYTHLRLWDIASQKEGLFPDPSGLDLKGLQKELRRAFNDYLKPFLTQKDVKQIVISPPKTWPPKVFVVSEGELFCTRLLNGELEKVGVANFFDSLYALTPLPLERFRKCEACDKWFLPTGKRIRKQRRFCSRACNLRETARQQRERIKKKKIKKGPQKRRIRV